MTLAGLYAKNERTSRLLYGFSEIILGPSYYEFRIWEKCQVKYFAASHAYGVGPFFGAYFRQTLLLSSHCGPAAP